MSVHINIFAWVGVCVCVCIWTVESFLHGYPLFW